MKSLIIILFTLLLLASCKSKNVYTVEIFYNSSAGGADTMMISEQDHITAANDSLALIEAQDRFNKKVSNTNVKKGSPVKFVVRNNNGNIITTAGDIKKQEIEDPMYPNQKP